MTLVIQYKQWYLRQNLMQAGCLNAAQWFSYKKMESQPVYTLPLNVKYEDSGSQLRKFVISLGEEGMQLQDKCETVPE